MAAWFLFSMSACTNTVIQPDSDKGTSQSGNTTAVTISDSNDLESQVTSGGGSSGGTDITSGDGMNPTDGGSGTTGTATSGLPTIPEPAGPDYIPRRMWRLTPEQFIGEIRVVFGNDTPNLGTIKSGSDIDGFFNASRALTLDGTSTQPLWQLSEGYADNLLTRLGSVLPCSISGAGTTCAESFLRERLPKAYRRPVTEQEITEYLDIYTVGEVDGFDQGIKGIAMAIIMSPHFLYRSELGELNSGQYQLTQFEIAQTISFMFTGHSADDQLWQDAEAGRLGDSEIRAAHAERLFPQSISTMKELFFKWLEIDILIGKGDGSFDAMVEDTGRYVEEIIFNGAGTLSEIFSSTDAWVSPDVLSYYGVGYSDEVSERVMLPPEQRAGVLTHTSWLAAHAIEPHVPVVMRGMSIWTRFMCGTLDAPPNGVLEAQAAIEGALSEDATQREKSEARMAIDSCGQCHDAMDPFGFLFENYDQLGMYRTQFESGQAVVAKATVPVLGTVDDAPSFSKALAESKELSQCFARRLLQHFLGADPQSIGGNRMRTEVNNALISSDTNIREALVALVKSDGFLVRVER